MHINIQWAKLGQAVVDCPECARKGQLCDSHVEQITDILESEYCPDQNYQRRQSMIRLTEGELKWIISERCYEIKNLSALVTANAKDNIAVARQHYQDLTKITESIRELLFELEIVQGLDKMQTPKDFFATGGIATKRQSIVGEDLSLRVVFPEINKEVKSDASEV